MSVDLLRPGRHDFRAQGHRLAYHVYGEGSPVIAIPGGPGFSHTYLRMPELERRLRMIYLDNIGTGDSERLPDPTLYSRASDVANLEELRKHLELDRLTLLGHSAGGFIAQEYALDRPERVERLVLYATTPTNRAEFDLSLETELAARAQDPRYTAAIGSLRETFSRLLDQGEASAIMNEALKLYLYDFEAGNGSVLRAVQLASDLDVVRMQQGTAIDFDYRPRLSSLDMPALIITGVRDFICAPRLGEMIHAGVPGSQLVTMQRSGHLAHLEEPEAFADAVASFLA